MQKKIIALAIAGLASTAAFAQSNVTVYGVVDVYGGNFRSNGDTANAINQGGLQGNRLGFKGVEDLGGGTKALFTIEYAVATDRNDNLGGSVTGTTFTRQAFVGATGSFGTAIAGRLQTLVYNHNAAYNPTFGTAVDTLNNVASRLNATNLPGAGANVARATNNAMGTQERLDNAVAYVSPSFGGLVLSGAYTTSAAAAEGEVQTANQITAGELAADYKVGAFSVGAVVRKANYAGTVGNLGTQVGASYDFGVAKVMGTLGTQANDGDTGARDTAGDSRVNVSNLAAVVPFGNGALIASLGKGSHAASDTTLTTSALVYKHSLSKRTSVYGGIANAKSDGAANSIGANLGGLTSGLQGNVTGVLAGINHNF